MKVKCARGPLHEAFQLALTVVPQRSTIPAVTNVKLAATGSGKSAQLELSCTDLEFGLKVRVPALEVKEEGTVVLPAQHMAAILPEQSSPDVDTSTTDTTPHTMPSTLSFQQSYLQPHSYQMSYEPV